MSFDDPALSWAFMLLLFLILVAMVSTDSRGDE
jgi:hypothetical protein